MENTGNNVVSFRNPNSLYSPELREKLAQALQPHAKNPDIILTVIENTVCAHMASVAGRVVSDLVKRGVEAFKDALSDNDEKEEEVG